MLTFMCTTFYWSNEVKTKQNKVFKANLIVIAFKIF